jgi:hypothetical protein
MESSRVLKQQRLGDVMARLTNKVRNRAVGGLGHRINGKRRVELYVRGKLPYVILFPTKRRIDCSELGLTTPPNQGSINHPITIERRNVAWRHLTGVLTVQFVFIRGTPKALANSSPGLLQPWVHVELQEKR